MFMRQLDWNDLRAFLALVRTGSLRRAADQTGMSAATLSRRIDGLESVLNEVLIQRTHSGSEITPAGQKIAASAEQMEAIARGIVATRREHSKPKRTAH